MSACAIVAPWAIQSGSDLQLLCEGGCCQPFNCIPCVAGIKDSTDEVDDRAQPRTGLMGALLGRTAEKEDADSQSSSSGTGNGTSKDSGLSQVMGAESAERESRPAMPAGMGPSSPSSSPVRAAGNLEVSSPGAGQRSSVVRSMILEKPPSFKVGAICPSSHPHIAQYEALFAHSHPMSPS